MAVLYLLAGRDDDTRRPDLQVGQPNLIEER
jgi:hypothetical protein